MKTEMCAFASAWAPERHPELGQKTILSIVINFCAQDDREKTSDV